MVFVSVAGRICSSHLQASESVLNVTVGPGDNITLQCDCTVSDEKFTVWYRKCSHSNQPPLVLKSGYSPGHDPVSWMSPLPRFQFVKNDSSNAYDLLITNITKSDEGFYYCGTETAEVEDGKHLSKTYVYTYGILITRLIFSKCSHSSL